MFPLHLSLYYQFIKRQHFFVIYTKYLTDKQEKWNNTPLNEDSNYDYQKFYLNYPVLHTATQKDNKIARDGTILKSPSEALFP